MKKELADYLNSVKGDTHIKNQFNQLCVWPGTVVGDSKKIQEDFVKFFKDELDVTVKYETEVKTLPDPGDLGMKTGGRNDLFFYIADDDIGKFAIPRLNMGIRWYEDVLGNGGGDIYPTEVLEKYEKTW